VILQQPVFRLLRLLNGGKIKNALYRLFGAHIGDDVFIAPDVYFDDVFPELVSIEDGCIIGEGTLILAHEFTIKHARFGRVHIEKQAVIGANSILRSGVTIGKYSIIAMDTLVNKDIPPNEIVGGIPEHEIRLLKKVF